MALYKFRIIIIIITIIISDNLPAYTMKITEHRLVSAFTSEVY